MRRSSVKKWTVFIAILVIAFLLMPPQASAQFTCPPKSTTCDVLSKDRLDSPTRGTGATKITIIGCGGGGGGGGGGGIASMYGAGGGAGAPIMAYTIPVQGEMRVHLFTYGSGGSGGRGGNGDPRDPRAAEDGQSGDATIAEIQVYTGSNPGDLTDPKFWKPVFSLSFPGGQGGKGPTAKHVGTGAPSTSVSVGTSPSGLGKELTAEGTAGGDGGTKHEDGKYGQGSWYLMDTKGHPLGGLAGQHAGDNGGGGGGGGSAFGQGGQGGRTVNADPQTLFGSPGSQCSGGGGGAGLNTGGGKGGDGGAGQVIVIW